MRHRSVNPSTCRLLLLVLCIAGLWQSSSTARHAAAAGPRVLPPGELPADVRLEALKDLDGYFPLVVPESPEVWNQRAEAVRKQILVSQGLWPLPTKQPLHSVIHGRTDLDGYTLEKVYFQSMPGFFVTGNLYRPHNKSGKLPGVLCPHGHWANGRFYDCGRDEVRKQIVQGAERFEDGGRNPLQSRCVQLARMGCVVFHYDMIGYADSRQITQDIIHGFRTQRPEMNRPENWGLFSPQAESHLQSAMGLQTFNSIRALDFLTSLPDVDPARIAVTGASGGGTQTFILSAIDPRVKVAFPAVMVSTAMQGGCTCENACCLRVDTGNIEIAALFAPKPLGLTAANDWTVEMQTKGLPELKQLYALLGAPDNVALTPLLHFGHNYNYVSRAAMYSWLNKHLGLGLDEPIVEEDYPRQNADQLTVWDQDHPQPAGGPDLERQLLAWWHHDSDQQLDAMLPTDASSLERYQQLVGTGLQGLVNRQIPDAQHVSFKEVVREERDGYHVIGGLLTYALPPREAMGATPAGQLEGVQEQLPTILLIPDNWKRQVCLAALPEGKDSLFDDQGTPHPPVCQLLKAGVGVCAADLLYQGEFVAGGQPPAQTRVVDNPREAAAYTWGYSPSLCAQRVRDLLTILAWLSAGEYRAERIDLVGVGTAGPCAALARALAGPRVSRLAMDTADFRFADISALRDPMFLPGAAKYHDVPGMLALAAPSPLWLAHAGEELPPPVAAAYRAAGQTSAVTCFTGPESERWAALAAWLLEE